MFLLCCPYDQTRLTWNQNNQLKFSKHPCPPQVRIGEEILAIPKDEAKELFAKQAIVSGPWLKEEEEEKRPRQKFVPKYPTSREPRFSKNPTVLLWRFLHHYTTLSISDL